MSFEYEIKNSKGKQIRISINPFGQVVLHVPRLIPNFVAEKFLFSKKDWILEKLSEIRERAVKKAKPFSPLKLTKKEKRNLYLNNKEKARVLAEARLKFFQKRYSEIHGIDLSWNRISIRDTKSRLGSCSSKKNLNFTYKIVFMKEDEVNYLIVHELCHLKEMNHSSRFWSLVSLEIPDHKNYKKMSI